MPEGDQLANEQSQDYRLRFTETLLANRLNDRIRSHVFLCTLAYYLQWHLKQRLEPLFAADGTHKDRQWTVRNVIERLAAIRRDKT